MAERCKFFRRTKLEVQHAKYMQQKMTKFKEFENLIYQRAEDEAEVDFLADKSTLVLAARQMMN